MKKKNKLSLNELAIIKDIKRQHWHLIQEKKTVTDYEKLIMYIYRDKLDTLRLRKEEDNIDEKQFKKGYYYTIEDAIIKKLCSDNEKNNNKK